MLNSRRKKLPANPGTDRATSSRTCHTTLFCRPLFPASFYLVSFRNQRFAPTSRKWTDQPTAASRRLFRGNASPRKEKRRDVCGAQNRKMTANLFWVCEERARNVAGECEKRREGKAGACARNCYATRKGCRSQTGPNNR